MKLDQLFIAICLTLLVGACSESESNDDSGNTSATDSGTANSPSNSIRTDTVGEGTVVDVSNATTEIGNGIVVQGQATSFVTDSALPFELCLISDSISNENNVYVLVFKNFGETNEEVSVVKNSSLTITDVSESYEVCFDSNEAEATYLVVESETSPDFPEYGAVEPVAPVTSPTLVLGIASATTDGTYKTGDDIDIEVSFSDVVTVSGTPQLELETGFTDQTVDYVSGSGTDTLTFSLTIEADDRADDLDYKSTASLTLNGGTITGADGNPAELELPTPGAANSLASSSAIRINRPLGRFNRLDAGEQGNCAILASGDVKCWGDGADGFLGRDSEVDAGDGIGTAMSALGTVNLGAGRTAEHITVGADHACAMLDNTDVKCWGGNSAGQLGQNNITDVGDGLGVTMASLNAIVFPVGRTAIYVIAGGIHTCALLDNYDLICWGHNGSGRLGQGDTVDRGDGVGDDVANIPAINLGVGRTARHVSAGSYSTCAILDNGDLKCWGYNPNGELGQDNTTDIGTGVGLSVADLPPINLGAGRTAVDVSSGYYHTCAVLDDASVKCWGGNSNGELGQNNTTIAGDGSGTAMASLPPIDLGGGRTAKYISAGIFHTCVHMDNDQVKCWGENGEGRLGQDNATPIGDGVGPNVSAANAITLSGVVSEIHASASLFAIKYYRHTCAMFTDNEVQCWGWGSGGVLGTDSTANIGDAPARPMSGLTNIDL